MNRLLLLVFILFSFSVSATEVRINDKVYVSSVTEAVTECGEYSVNLISERMPPEYSREVSPYTSPDFIPGFYGSHSWVSQQVVLTPTNIKIASANEFIPSEDLPRAATYLPSSLYCVDASLAILFWSGGNGIGAEVMLEFVKDGELLEKPSLVEDFSRYLGR